MQLSSPGRTGIHAEASAFTIRSEHGDGAILEGFLEKQLGACEVEVTAPMQDVIDKIKKGR